MTSTTPGDLHTRRKRLRFRSWHRGTQEADILLGNFADTHLADLSAAELDQYETLLDQQDVDIVAWIGGIRQPPTELDTPVLGRLKTLDYVKLTS